MSESERSIITKSNTNPPEKMLEVAIPDKFKVAIPDKFKRRMISAVRRFPGGCRIPAPTNKTLNVVESDVPSIPLSIPKEEPKESNGSTSLPLPPTPEEKEVTTVEDGSGRGKKRSGEEIVKLEGSSREVEDDGVCGPPPKFVSGEGEGSRSRRYSSLKKRKVSAVRKFPAGCGRNSSKIGSEDTAVVTSSESKTGENKLLVGGETSKKVEAMRSREHEVTKKVGEPMVKSPEPKNLRGEASMKICELKNLDGEFMDKSPKVKDLDEETMMKSPKPLNLDDKYSVKSPMLNHLQGEGTIKSLKSKNSYVEDMAESPKPKKSEGEASARSPKLNNLQGESRVKSPTFKISDEKALASSPTPKIIHDEGIAKSPKVKDLGVEVMVNHPYSKNLDRERIVKSTSYKNLDGELSINSLKLKSLEGKVMVKSPKFNYLNGEDMVKSTVPKNFDGDASVKSPKLKNSKGEAIVKSSKVRDLDEETMVNSPKMKNMDGEKSPVTEQLLKEVGIIGSSVDKVGVDVKKGESKQIKDRAGEISNKAQISPFKSSMNEDIMEEEEHQEKKRLMRSISEKNIGGSGIKQISKKDKLKQESRGEGPRSGAKAVDSGGKSLMGKHGEKVSLNNPKDEDSVKRRKFADDAEDESPISQVKESLDAYGDRLVVQALMSASNCPWTRGKKPAVTNSRPVMPKLTAKDKQKWTKKISSEENEMDMEDEDDSVSQDSENGKDLVVYQQSRERSITLPPYVPPRQNHNGSNSEGASARAMVKRALRLFQLITRKILKEEEAKSMGYDRTSRVDIKANSILKKSNNYVNWNGGTRTIGELPGVEVGDEYHFRVELSIIGMHYQLQGGIDYTKRCDGRTLATCIVASGGYSDDIDGSDILIYSGSGGNPAAGKDKQAGDQKLERGNLALKNSIDAKTPVRVVYGFKEKLKGSDSRKLKKVSTLSYDGLYLVEKYWLEKGPQGFSVFKFQLRRIPGQPEIALKEVMRAKKSEIREGLITKDISDGKERIPICVINTVDGERPTPFKYRTEVIYPSSYRKKPPSGCDCTNGCADSEDCSCAMKNGGEISFNYYGYIVQAKPLVYECGPSCKCHSSCHNRVSQHGIKIPLEIFKTPHRGWGVRSLCSIPSGSFICEYIGEMLQDTEAEQRNNDEYLFDIGHNYDDHTLWEGLPNLIPSLQSNAVCETVEGDGFTIDAAEFGNVGRFINHSCSPNLYAQNVLYDHDDKRIPHIMFFAADNIPPLQELTYHYNYSIDQVRDEQGNVKKKDCFCGSSECTGRLY